MNSHVFLLYFYAELKMARKPAWISTVKSEIGKSPVALNVFFGFILVCLEELVEVEFACPCNPTWNALFAATFFIVPAILIFLLMLYIRGCGRKCSKERWKNVGVSGVPAMLWLILMFLDGQYFACAMTSWSGIFVSFNGSSHQKWCKPANQNSSEELIIKTQGFFALSQVRKNLMVL